MNEQSMRAKVIALVANVPPAAMSAGARGARSVRGVQAHGAAGAGAVGVARADRVAHAAAAARTGYTTRAMPAAHTTSAARTRVLTTGVALALLAVAVLGRVAFAGVPNVQPVTALCIVAGIVCGRRWGFTVGISAALLSNMVLGQGAWTPFQMAGWGLAGWGAGALFGSMGLRARTSSLSARWILVCAYGFVVSLAFGVLLDSQIVLLFGGAMPAQTVLGIYAAGLPFNLAHAVGTVAFLAPLCIMGGACAMHNKNSGKVK